jgi:hypothetical protein
MTLSRSPDPVKQEAHKVLDDLKMGIYHPVQEVMKALQILGEPVFVVFED